MASTLPPLVAVITANITELKAKMGEAQASMAETAGKGESSFAKMAPAMKAVTAVGLGVAAGVGEIIHVSVDAAKAFQSSTNAMAAQAGIPVAAANQIGKAFLGTAGDVTFSAQQQIEALGPVSGVVEQLTGHALNAKDANALMAASMDLAEASGSSLGDSTSSLATLMRTYGMNLKQASSASDMLFNASRMTHQGIATLTQGMDRLHARLGPLAPSLKDTAALLTSPAFAAVGSRGLMTASTAMATLLGGSKATNAELKRLGVTVQDSHGNFVGMASVISQMQPKLAGMGTAQQALAEKTLFGAGAAGLMGSVIKGGAAGWDKATAAVSQHGTAQQAAAKNTATMEGSEKKLKAAVGDTTVLIGQAFIPVITHLLNKVLPVITAISRWVEHNQRLTAMILGVTVGVGVLVAGAVGLAVVINAVSTAVGLFSKEGMIARAASAAWSGAQWLLNAALDANPIGLIIIGIAALVVGIILAYQHSSTFRGIVKGLFSDLQAFGAFLSNTLGPILHDIANVIGSVAGGVGSVMGGIGGALGGLVGHHAAGGYAAAGSWSVVGEKGPELLHMGSSGGSIAPNSALMPAAGSSGGGAGMSQNDSSNLQRLVQLMEHLVENTQPGTTTGGPAALAAVMSQVVRQRGRGLVSVA